jgi:hypothetical protein
VYPSDRVATFIAQNFIAVKIHIKQQPDTFKRFGVQWTPTLLTLDSDGVERYRFEGFLPANDFLAQLALGLAHSAFAHEQWRELEARFGSIVRDLPPAPREGFPQTTLRADHSRAPRPAES